MQEDYLLIIQLNGGSKRAFSVIYDKYVGIIYSYVNSILRDDLLAEDITQFSFMQLWKHRDRISPYRNLPAYLYVVARNAAYKAYIKQEKNLLAQLEQSIKANPIIQEFDDKIIGYQNYKEGNKLLSK